MSPRSSTLLALALVLAAGIPLPALTGARPSAAADAAAEAPPAEEAAVRATYVSVQFSGQPTALVLRFEGRELARLPQADAAAQCWETELVLPAAATLALEVEATWAEGGEARAVTVTLEPEGLPARSCTQWSEQGTATLHRLFPFSW